MSKQSPALFAFNRGLVSPLGVARTDQKRIALAATVMTNWMPRVLGSMSLRPGFQYLGSTASNAYEKMLDFVFSTTDTALIELTNMKMRVWVDEVPITRPSVSSLITNGTFDTDLTGWTDADEVGGSSAWVSGGYMGLIGNGTAAAIRYQLVTNLSPGIEHALRITVNRGPVVLRVGSTLNGDDYITQTTLNSGVHSLAFTPTGNFYVQFQTRLKRAIYVDSCVIESAGVMEIPTVWLDSDLNNIRDDQTGDILYIAYGRMQQSIERRATRSWSAVDYLPEDGPFLVENVGPITITPTALSGNITLTASAPLFKTTNVDSLYRLTSTGQTVTASVVAQNQFTAAIRVTDVGTSRAFLVIRANTWVATVTLQRSLTSETGPWEDVATYTTDGTDSYNDALDNAIAWYRIGVKTGNFTSGTVDLTLDYALGSIDGIVRITSYNSQTSVNAEVLTDLGGLAATDIWAEGKWSDRRGWPSAVALHEGRLWWFGKDSIIGSISDAFDSFDETFEGDAGPLNRTIGSGPVDQINWGLSLQRLIVGGQGAEFSIRSSSLDEPLTPTNFNVKQASTRGSSSVNPVKIDQQGVYIQRNGIRVLQLDFAANGYDYESKDLTLIVPELGLPGIIRMDVQRNPDTRLHCVRSDGTVMVLVYGEAEDVLCWLEVETDGLIEDVVVLPGLNGQIEDRVYYVVNRTINGVTKRYLERWAMETECRGAAVNKQADSFMIYSGPLTTTITGLSYMEGKNLIVWANGIDLSPTAADGTQTTFTVTGGQINLPIAVSSAVLGLGYTAQWQSAKLGIFDAINSMLNRDKTIIDLGLVLAYVHAKGLKFGSDFDNLDDMPEIEQAFPVGANEIRESYDEQPIEFPGTWLTDARLCLQAQAPRPVTVLAVKPLVDIV